MNEDEITLAGQRIMMYLLANPGKASMIALEDKGNKIVVHLAVINHDDIYEKFITSAKGTYDEQAQEN